MSYTMIRSKAEIHEGMETKKFLNSKLEPYFQNPENPIYVVLKFVPQRIEYYHEIARDLCER